MSSKEADSCAFTHRQSDRLLPAHTSAGDDNMVSTHLTPLAAQNHGETSYEAVSLPEQTLEKQERHDVAATSPDIKASTQLPATNTCLSHNEKIDNTLSSSRDAQCAIRDVANMAALKQDARLQCGAVCLRSPPVTWCAM